MFPRSQSVLFASLLALCIGTAQAASVPTTVVKDVSEEASSVPTLPAPAPASALLFATAFGGVAWRARRRRRQDLQAAQRDLDADCDYLAQGRRD
ncbi:MAG: hypothetical protein FJ197_01275 [Gammaproteobacteria bacterium]|nr:hypothetical protein [Gammaproteobacteria bacterium]